GSDACACALPCRTTTRLTVRLNAMQIAAASVATRFGMTIFTLPPTDSAGTAPTPAHRGSRLSVAPRHIRLTDCKLAFPSSAASDDGITVRDPAGHLCDNPGGGAWLSGRDERTM